MSLDAASQPRSPGPLPRSAEASAESFAALDLRVGTVVACAPLPEARVPAYSMRVDCGPLGVLRSSARLCDLYAPDELIGSQVICVVNLPPRQIGRVRSEVLVLGVYRGSSSAVVLLRPERPCADGDRIG